MNLRLRSCLAALVFSAAGLAAVSASEPGYVEFGTFTPSAKGDFVEVNLKEGLIKLAARLAARDEPAAAEVLRNIKHIRVNVIGLDEGNRAATTGRVEAIRADLVAQGWEQVVTVKGRKEEDVAIYLKSRSEDVIEGIVVTVIEDDCQAVLVNVVGNIEPEQLAELGDRFDIEPIKGTRRIARSERRR